MFAADGTVPLVIGNQSAPITVMFFHDYSSPITAYWNDEFQAFKKEFISTNQVKVELYAYNRWAPAGDVMANSVECMRLYSDKAALDLHDALISFRRTEKTDLTAFELWIHAKIIELSGNMSTEVNTCVANKAAASHFLDYQAVAAKYNVNGMPSFIYNNNGIIRELVGIKASINAHTTIVNEITHNNALQHFVDVPSNHINSDAINFLYGKGWIQGYDDTTFKPNQTINRAEFTKIIANISLENLNKNASVQTSLCSEFESQNIHFLDVSTQSWYWPYVCFAKRFKAIDGYDDNTFRPSNTINFAETAKIIASLLPYQGIPSSNEQPWYIKYVRKLAKYHAIPTSIYAADQAVTRGEMAEIIYRMMAENNKPSRSTEFFLENEIVHTNNAEQNFVYWGDLEELELQMVAEGIDTIVSEKSPVNANADFVQLVIKNTPVQLQLGTVTHSEYPRDELITLNIDGTPQILKNEIVYKITLNNGVDYYIALTELEKRDRNTTVSLFLLSIEDNAFFDVNLTRLDLSTNTMFMPIAGLKTYVLESDNNCGTVVVHKSQNCVSNQAAYGYDTSILQDTSVGLNKIRVTINEYSNPEMSLLESTNSSFTLKNMQPVLRSGQKVYEVHSYYGTYYYWVSHNKDILITEHAICSDAIRTAYWPDSFSLINMPEIELYCKNLASVVDAYMQKYPSDL